MRKEDIQLLYNRIKAQKTTKASPTFFTDQPQNKGCRTCGRSSWRPKS